MRTLINNSRRGSKVQLAEAVEEADKSPFTYEIMYADIPAKCVLPTVPSIFSGSESVVHHLKQYTLSLMQWGRNDMVLCRYFPASLAGEALAWFDGLPERSISSFKDLQRIFLTTYITNNMLRPGIETLFNLRRIPTESLRGLVTRWRTVCSELAWRVDEKNFILAFVNALIPTDLLLLTRTVHVVENDSKHEKGEPSTPFLAKLVAVTSGDQEWINQQRYKESRRRNYEPRSYNTGYQQRNNQGPRFGERRPNAPDFEDLKLPRLNMTVEKGKLAHFVEGYVPPPPPPLRDNQQIYRIEIDRGTQKPNCKTIIHAAKSIQNLHDNILKRVHKRDFEGNEIFSVTTREPLEEWQKREITFSTKDAP
ncbi:uncharacterized protein LOC113304138 [Papaver somniferum]|uniref:uncharacterized protein LOC113304138 n=1 Tax=Papaver somniferum TaxID=3469 RepID=UPI000E6F5A08|nr:uncharacterized protein LOC113304138 [Papaver somniferum]